MKNKEWEKRIRSAAKKDVPDVKEEIKSSDVYQNHITSALHKRSTTSGKSFALRYVYAGMAVVAVFMLALILPFGIDGATSVYLDINPGLRIDIDEEDNVLDLFATNPDGEDFLTLLDEPEDKPLDDVIDNIIDKAIERGYLSDEAPYIVYDVRGPSAEQEERILQRLEERLPDVVGTRIAGFAVMRGHGGDETPDEQERAQTHGMSVMRLRLIEHIDDETDDYSFADLKDLSVGELRRIMEEKDIPHHTPGPPSDRPGGPPW